MNGRTRLEGVILLLAVVVVIVRGIDITET
jgi:hypothetical protein